MAFENINNVYLIGIGGIGMSGLARYFKGLGKNIAGFDRISTTLTKQLIHEGMQVCFDDNCHLIPENFKQQKNTLVVYTPAISATSQVLNFFTQNNFDIKKRAEVLGSLTDGKIVIAVAGSHGKTTTSSMIAHILKFSGYDCTAFLGGIASNYNTNFIKGNNEVFVVEADEYDRSFLQLNPDIAIVTSTDPDHLDIYKSKEELLKSFNLFARKVNKDGLLLLGNLANIDRNNVHCRSFIYGLTEKCDYKAIKILEENLNGCLSSLRYNFEFKSPESVISSLTMGMNGIHNINNAVAAIAVAEHLGINKGKIGQALACYTGVKRRFEYVFNHGSLIYIDDYAHHPTEISACINSVKLLYPGKKITAIFQPHLFSRTRDFIDGFAESLSVVDELKLLPVYPAREEPIAGIDSARVLEKVILKKKSLCDKSELTNEFNLSEKEIIVTMGAGDIDQFVSVIKNCCLKSEIKSIANKIKEIFDGEVLLDEILSPYTTLKIGGPADIFLKPVSKQGVAKVMKYLLKHRIPYFVMGNGSNLLISDKGIRGVVFALKNGFDYVQYNGDLVTAGASYSIPKLSLETIRNGLQGLETTAGIPATVGGAVRMNAGAYNTEIFDLVKEVEVVRNGELTKLKSEEIEKRYRHTNLGDDIVLEATFKLNKTDNIQEVLNKRKELLNKRNASQPVNKLNVGSLFKNPQGDFAARLIEDTGLKGFVHGNAMISDKHANFLINNGNSSSNEIMELIDIIKSKVFQKFNIMLELEVQLVGEGI